MTTETARSPEQVATSLARRYGEPWSLIDEADQRVTEATLLIHEAESLIREFRQRPEHAEALNGRALAALGRAKTLGSEAIAIEKTARGMKGRYQKIEATKGGAALPLLHRRRTQW